MGEWWIGGKLIRNRSVGCDMMKECVIQYPSTIQWLASDLDSALTHNGLSDIADLDSSILKWPDKLFTYLILLTTLTKANDSR
jgi:hypothetical protein